MSPARPRPPRLILPVVLLAGSALPAAAEPFNPYGMPEAVVAPVAPDGTLRWGVFYKSAEMQLAYERLWKMGACRGTSKEIMIPVEENKLLIDRLPEADFVGVVQGVAGGLAGGLVAFADDEVSATYVAHLHPAGVTNFSVVGRAPAAIVQPGMAVRIVARVDARGRGSEPLRKLDVVTPPAGFKPDEVRPDIVERIVGVVTTVRGRTMQVRVDAGKLRRLTFTLAEDAVATIDAASPGLVAPGDRVELRGRLWTGEGCHGAGSVFASRVTVTKAAPAERRPDAAAAGLAGKAAADGVE
ncbi:MAG: hypothetical protein ACK5SI_01510 [Planctomycetia bacterium]|jgi:hypothetical protein